MDALTASELERHPVVVAAFAAAWADSFHDDGRLRHEEGGWIYQNRTTGEIQIRRSQPGIFDGIVLSYPAAIADCHVVATYHTHPNPTAGGWIPDPSPDDIYNADITGVPWFIISDSGIYVVGPDRRIGGLTGPARFPLIGDNP
jgi:hypothetical protein